MHKNKQFGLQLKRPCRRNRGQLERLRRKLRFALRRMQKFKRETRKNANEIYEWNAMESPARQTCESATSWARKSIKSNEKKFLAKTATYVANFSLHVPSREACTTFHLPRCHADPLRPIPRRLWPISIAKHRTDSHSHCEIIGIVSDSSEQHRQGWYRKHSERCTISMIILCIRSKGNFHWEIHFRCRKLDTIRNQKTMKNAAWSRRCWCRFCNVFKSSDWNVDWMRKRLDRTATWCDYVVDDVRLCKVIF